MINRLQIVNAARTWLVPTNGIISFDSSVEEQTITGFRVTVKQANPNGATVFNVLKNGVELLTDELTLPANETEISINGLSIPIVLYDEIALSLTAVPTGGVKAPVNFMVLADESLANIMSEADLTQLAEDLNIGSGGRSSDAIAFGDSITEGVGASDSAHKYANLIASAKNWSATNNAVGGDFIADQILQIYGENSGQNFWLQIGSNDARVYEDDEDLRAVFKAAHLAACAYLAIPESYNKFNGLSGYPIYSGSWSNTPAYAMGKVSATNGNTITFSLSGKTIYIGTILVEGVTGYFDVTIDGADKGRINCFTDSAVDLGTTNNPARVYVPVATRFDGLDDTLHEVVLTVGGSGSAFFDWAAGSGNVRQKNAPIVWAGNIPRMAASGYAAFGGSDSNTGDFNRFIAENIADLQSDGLLIVSVDTQGAIDTENDLDTDGLHPNDSGHQKIADAYLFAMESLPIAPPRGQNERRLLPEGGAAAQVPTKQSDGSVIWQTPAGGGSVNLASFGLVEQGYIFSDDFSTLNTSTNWTAGNSGGGSAPSVSSGAANLNPGTSDGGLATLISKSAFNLLNNPSCQL